MEKVKEIISKNGLYVKLGALAVAIIGFFMNFLKGKVEFMGIKETKKVTYFDYKDLVGKDHKGFAVFVLILIIVAIVWLLAEKYAKELYEKVPAGIAKYVGMCLTGLALILTLIDGITAKSRLLDQAGSYGKEMAKYIKISPQIGLILIVLGLVAAIAVMVYEEFFMNKTSKTTQQPTA